MSILWTIKGEAGKAIDATVRTLEQLQVEDAVVEFASAAADTLRWTVWLGSISEAAERVPDFGQRITLYRNDGRFFTGNVTNVEPNLDGGRLGFDITVEGPWWWLAKEPLSNLLPDQTGETNVRSAYAFPTGNVKDHLQGLITRAIALGMPIRAGSIATCFNIPRLTLRTMSFAAAFADLMRWLPDGTLYFDYTGSDAEHPALCMQRRVAAATVTITPSAGHFPKVELKPRLELKIDEVKIAGAKRITKDNARLTQWSLQEAAVAGTVTNRQIVTIAGPELDTILPQDWTDAVVVRSKQIFPSYFGVSSDLIASKDERLRQAGGGWSVGQFSGYNQSGNSFTIPGVETRVNDADGNALPAGYSYWLAAGEPKDWWPKQSPPIDYIQARATATIHGRTWVDYPPPNGYTPTVPDWAELVGATQINYIGRLSAGGDLMWISGYYATISVSFIAVKTHWNVDTTIIRDEDYGFVQPPPDLADNLLAAQNWLPFEGSVSQTIDPGTIPESHVLGKRLDVMELLPAYESMGALIRGQSIALRTGDVTYTVGVPPRLAYRDLAERFRSSGADNVVWLNEINPVSPPSGGGAIPTNRLLGEDGGVLFTEDGDTIVSEADV